jgi:hypothetical protein
MSGLAGWAARQASRLCTLAVLIGGVIALGGCAEEAPTGLGQELLPENAIRTFEVILEPGQFLLTDTSFSGYGVTRGGPFAILARDFEGVLTSHILARYSLRRTIAVRDTGNVLVVDSFPTLVAAEIVILVDTAGSDATAPLQIAAHAIAEAWDPQTASWTYRDTSVAALPWAVPGGTPGAQLAVDTWEPGDTIVLPIDTATLRLWSDTLDATRGALIRIVDGTGRLRTTAPVLRVHARSSRADTTVTLVHTPIVRDFIYTPVLATESGDIRSGGLPGWRTFLRFRSDLRDLVVSCGADCSAPLRDLDITRAELLLQPTSPPPGFRPEAPIVPTAYLGLVSPEVPLRRTLLGSAVGTVREPLAPERFTPEAAPVPLALTDYLRLVVADSTPGQAFFRPEWIVLTPGAQVTFGFGAFEPGPRLRLVLSTAQENQLP